MPPTPKLDSLVEALERLERQLEEPHVSGELHLWLDETKQLLADVQTQWSAAVTHEHPLIYETIQKNSPNLVREAEKLQQNDQEITRSFEAFAQQTDQFASSARETAMAEQQFHVARERLVDSGLALVIAVRKHRAALSRWHAESVQRVNGGGD